MAASSSRPPESPSNWQSRVLDNLRSLPTTSSPDCCIIVGTERIPTHKTALQLNSSLLESGDVAYNQQSQLTEIELLPEFSEYFNLVSEIVNSFYTGTLQVVQENMRVVYKFAKCYNVQWVMDLVRPMFVDYIRKGEGCERFLEILKFAQSICCADLSAACCQLLDSQMFLKLSEPAVLSELDFFTMKSITGSDMLRIPEKDVFDLVVQWLKANDTRCDNFGTILENIQYDLIDSDVLSEVVFDFILDQPSLPDASRKAILKKVKAALRLTPKKNSRSSDSCPSNPVRSYTLLNDDCLRKIDLRVQGKTHENRYNLIRFSKAEIISVIRDKFLHIEDNLREMVINYFFKNKEQLGEVIHLLLPLYDVCPDIKLLWLVIEYCTTEDYYKLYEIPWNLVSFETILTMITNSTIVGRFLSFDDRRTTSCSQEYGKFNYRFYSERFEGCGMIELIMLWALSNPLKLNQIKQLVEKICFLKIPYDYQKEILLPALKVIFTDVKKFQCAHGHNQNDLEHWTRSVDMSIAEVPGKIYFLERFTHDMGRRSLYYRLEFTGYQSNDCLQLSSVGKEHIGKDDRLRKVVSDKTHSFILYDGSQPHLENYPLFVRCSSLSAIKSITKCYKEMRFMFYKRTDENKKPD